jgi:hypothetical protein
MGFLALQLGIDQRSKHFLLPLSSLGGASQSALSAIAGRPD